MNKLNRFLNYGLESDDSAAIPGTPVSQPEEIEMVTEVTEAEDSYREEEAAGEQIESAVAATEALIVTVEAILRSGKASREVSKLVELQARAIAEPFGFDMTKFSLESHNDNPTDHLQASCEGLFNLLERYGSAVVIQNYRASEAIRRMIFSDRKLIVNTGRILGALENHIKHTKNSHDAKLDFSFSGVGKYFKVSNSDELPDFKSDFGVTNYVINDYNKITVDTLNNFAKIVNSGNVSTPEGLAQVAKKIDALKNPCGQFKKEYLGTSKIMFGQNKFIQESPESPVIIRNDESLLAKLFSHTVGEMAPKIEFTIGQYYQLIQEGVAYSNLLMKGINHLEGQLSTLAHFEEAMKSLNAARHIDSGTVTQILNVGRLFKGAYTSPLIQEVSRGVKTLMKLSLVLRSTLGNSPWKLRNEDWFVGY